MKYKRRWCRDCDRYVRAEWEPGHLAKAGPGILILTVMTCGLYLLWAIPELLLSPLLTPGRWHCPRCGAKV